MVNITKEDAIQLCLIADKKVRDEDFSTSNYVLLDGGYIYNTNMEFVEDLNSKTREIKGGKLVVGVELVDKKIMYKLTDLKPQKNELLNILFYKGETDVKTYQKKVDMSNKLEKKLTNKLVNIKTDKELQEVLTMFRDYREILKTTPSFMNLDDNTYLYQFSCVREGQEERSVGWTIGGLDEHFEKHLQNVTRNGEGLHTLSEVKLLQRVKVF